MLLCAASVRCHLLDTLCAGRMTYFTGRLLMLSPPAPTLCGRLPAGPAPLVCSSLTTSISGGGGISLAPIRCMCPLVDPDSLSLTARCSLLSAR